MTPAPQHPAPLTRRIARVATIATIATTGMLAAAVLSGCSIVSAASSHEKERVYASWADAPAAPGSAAGPGASAGGASGGGDDDHDNDHDNDQRFVPPAFVPTDAAALRIRITTDGPGDIVAFTSATPLDSTECVAGPLTGSALLETTWWPAEVPADGMVCDGDWQVFALNGVTYGWISV